MVPLDARSLYDPTELFQRLTKNKKSARSEASNVLNEEIVASEPTLLVLDEVQRIAPLLSSEYRFKVSDFFYCYHDFKSEKGFILLLGGLSTSKAILRQFDLSRFNAGADYHLKGLNEDDVSKILYD